MSSYIPLVGNNNIIAVRGADNATPILAGTLGGNIVVGRPGSMKTSLLLNLSEFIDDDFEPVFYMDVACPASFSTPADIAEEFDYSQLFPVVNAGIISTFVAIAPPFAWPASMTAFFTNAIAALPYSSVFSGRPIVSVPPSVAYPYGYLTFEFSGAATNSSGLENFLVSVTVDFCSSTSS
jgi:hypothetical protein